MHIIVGGTYFAEKRIGFFPCNHNHNIEYYDWRTILSQHHRTVMLTQPYFVFGLKGWVRKLGKKKLTKEEIVNRICEHLSPDVPMGVLDDCALGDELRIGDILRKRLFEEYDCKVYLLREYLKTKKYDKRVIPFSIPCEDNTAMAILNSQKKINLFFRGDKSNKERKEYCKKIKTDKSIIQLYNGGEKSPKKIPRDRFLLQLSMSKICLSFAGSGYDTFRYQEIPSVGSIIATPKYPWVVRNDYVDRVSCIKFDKPQEVLGILKEPQQLDDIQQASIENFRKYHTVAVRYKEFEEYAYEVCRD